MLPPKPVLHLQTVSVVAVAAVEDEVPVGLHTLTAELHVAPQKPVLHLQTVSVMAVAAVDNAVPSE